MVFEKKYTIREAETQYLNVIEALTNAGFIDEEAKVKSQKDEMEGGEPSLDEDFFNLSQYQNDTEDYSGKAKIAKLLLQQTVINPIFGDLLKEELLCAELKEVECQATKF